MSRFSDIEFTGVQDFARKKFLGKVGRVLIAVQQLLFHPWHYLLTCNIVEET